MATGIGAPFEGPVHVQGGWVLRNREDLEPGAVDVEGPSYGRTVLVAGAEQPHTRMLHALVSDMLNHHRGGAACRDASTSAMNLEELVGKADRDLLVQALQALHAQRVSAWNAQNAYANRTGQAPLNADVFGIDEAAAMLRRLGAGPSVL